MSKSTEPESIRVGGNLTPTSPRPPPRPMLLTLSQQCFDIASGKRPSPCLLTVQAFPPPESPRFPGLSFQDAAFQGLPSRDEFNSAEGSERALP